MIGSTSTRAAAFRTPERGGPAAWLGVRLFTSVGMAWQDLVLAARAAG